MATKFVEVMGHKDDAVVVDALVVPWNMAVEEVCAIVVVHDSYHEEFVACEVGVTIDGDVVQVVGVASFLH